MKNFAFMNHLSSDPQVTKDEGTLLVPLDRGCKISQFALYERAPNGRFSVTISSLAYDYMERVDLGALLLHEAAHGYFVRIDSTLAIRQFVTFLSAPAHFRKRNAAAFEKLVRTRQSLSPGEFR